MNTHMKPKTKWKIGAVVVFAALAILLPETVSAVWHVVHGRSVQFRAWKITVPFEWYAVRRGEGMSLERMSRLSWQKNPVATFLPVHFGPRYKFDYNVFDGVQEKLLHAQGYSSTGPQRDIHLGGQDGRCWTFTSKADREQLWISCVVPKDLTSVDYIGPEAYANDFFSLLGNIERVAPGS